MFKIIARLFGNSSNQDPRFEKEQWLSNRLSYMMHFKDPGLFDSIEYQKEGLLVLMASALRTRTASKKWAKDPTNDELEGKYHVCRDLYRYDVETLRHAHAAFRELDIHWSKLPEFIKKWQECNSTVWDQRTTEKLGLLKAA